MAALAGGLPQTLEVLDLGGNPLGEGVLALAPCLPLKLRKLDLLRKATSSHLSRISCGDGRGRKGDQGKEGKREDGGRGRTLPEL